MGLQQLLKKLSSPLDGKLLGVFRAFSVKVGGVGLNFLFSLMLARMLGAKGSGVYFLGVTIVNITATLARLGFDNAALKYAAVAFDDRDRSSMASLYRQSAGWLLASSLLLVLLLWFWGPYLPLGGSSEESFRAILPTMLIAVFPMTFLLVQGEFFKAIGQPGTATFVQTGAVPSVLVLGALWLFWTGEATTESFALLFAVACITGLVVASLYWLRCYPGTWLTPGHFDTRTIFRTGLPLLMVASMNMIMGWTDIVVLGIWSDAKTVGIYSIATRTATLTSLILLAVNSVTAPRFATLHASGRLAELDRLARRSAAAMTLAALPVVLTLVFFPDWILHFFGYDFTEGANFLRLLSLGQFVNVAVGSVGYLLMMTGHERVMRNIVAVSAVLNLVGNLLLVPHFGGIGAACSTAGALALLNLTAFYFVLKKLNVNTLSYLSKGVS